MEEHIEKAKADGKKTTKLEEQAKILDAKALAAQLSAQLATSIFLS